MDAPPIPARPTPQESSRRGSAPPVPPLPPGFTAPNGIADIPPRLRGGNGSLVSPRPQRNWSNVPVEMAQSLEAQASFQSLSNPMPFRGPSPSPQAAGNYPAEYSQLTGQTGNSFTYPGSYPSLNFPVPQPTPGAFSSSAPITPSASYSDPSSQYGVVPMHRASSSTSSFSQMSSLETYAQNRDDLRPFSVAPGGGAHYPASPQPGLQRTPSNSGALDVTAPAIFRPELIPFAPIIPKPLPGQPPILTASLPNIESLSIAAQSVATVDNPARKVAWSRQVLNLLDRMQTTEQTLNPETTVAMSNVLKNEGLIVLVEQAIKQVTVLSNDVLAYAGTNLPLPTYIPEALYLKATLEQSGLFPHLVAKDLRQAFKDFETAARNGLHAGWFKIGRDYESVNDWKRARDAFERGATVGEKNCLYRMGMAYLQGQLDLPKNSEAAIPLLKQAADIADVESPQAAYVLGMLLLGSYSHIDIPSIAFIRYLPRPSSANPDPRTTEAKRYIERAAYLNYGPAQTKAGWAHEVAKMGCPYDPLLSVQYYCLASQQGEDEADMALSKWFLCGAEGYFEKEERLAYTFAEKAARKGFPTAEFALGYYSEIGVGNKRDVGSAVRWYEKAAFHGNIDASARLRALKQQYPEVISRQQHDNLTQNRLVRKRTQAKTESNAAGRRMAASSAASGGVAALAAAQSVVTSTSRITQQQPHSATPEAAPRPAASTTKTSSTSTQASSLSGPNKGPATFEEMGYHSTALDEKECVIM